MRIIVLLLCFWLLVAGVGIFAAIILVGGILWALKGLLHLARPASPRRR